MDKEDSLTFHKNERLNNRTAINKLFGGGSKSFSIYPIRAVYMSVEDADVPVSILISVPKLRFKRAVKRNRIKRQIREAYRKHKSILWKQDATQDKRTVIAFIWISDKLFESEVIEQRIITALQRIKETL